MAETENKETPENKVPENENKENKETESKEKESRTLTQEEINKLIEGARKQEKDKLYETISSLKEQVSGLSQERKEDKDEKERIKKEAVDAAEAERIKKLSAEDKLAEQLRKFEERLAKEATEREALQAQLEKARQEQELDKYRTQVLNDAGDEIIPDLVRGNSREEIETSAAVAKQKYQDFFNAALERAKGTKDPEKPKIPSPADPDLDPLEEEAMRGLIPEMNPDDASRSKVSEDYKKNRDQILAKVANAYGKSNR